MFVFDKVELLPVFPGAALIALNGPYKFKLKLLRKKWNFFSVFLPTESPHLEFFFSQRLFPKRHIVKQWNSRSGLELRCKHALKLR